VVPVAVVEVSAVVVEVGAVELADPLTPAVVLPVVAGPVVEVDAEVPGALAEVLPVVEAVPVCAAVPEAVVVLPGFVVAVLGLLVAVGEVASVLLACVEPAAEVVVPVVGVVPVVLALGAVDAVFAPLMSALVELVELGVVLDAVVLLEAQLPVARTLCPTCAVRSSLLCSSTALPLPICSQNLPSFWATQPVMLFFSEEVELPCMPLWLCVPEAVLSVAPAVELVDDDVDCGVLFVSSVRVDPDVLGTVEVWAASIDTEKQNAAAVVISFFMVFVSCGIKQNLPTMLKMRLAGYGFSQKGT
jgi:hypothetical protein